MWRSRKVAKDLTGFMNFTAKKNRGFNTENLYVSKLEILSLATIKKFPLTVPLALPMIKRRLKKNYLKNGQLTFNLSAQSYEDYVSMGEKSFKEWLKLTKLGLSLQPLTNSSFGLQDKVDFDLAKGKNHY